MLRVQEVTRVDFESAVKDRAYDSESVVLKTPYEYKIVLSDALQKIKNSYVHQS